MPTAVDMEIMDTVAETATVAVMAAPEYIRAVWVAGLLMRVESGAAMDSVMVRRAPFRVAATADSVAATTEYVQATGLAAAAA
jgi:hypothetical protein